MDNGKQLASFLQNVKLVPGMEIGVRSDGGQLNWVAPNKGQYPIGHISTFQSVLTTAARTYRDSDEAVRASRDDARNMRNDCGIMECLESRQRCTALLNWHIEPEDDTSQEQKDLAADMTKIVGEICRFTEYRRALMEAIWFGKYGIQNRFGWQEIGGRWRILPTPLHHTDNGWVPINGDKIVFRFDDGNLPEGAYPGQMGIRVGLANWGDDKLIRNRWKVEATERGLAYFLSKEEQKLCVIHTHMIEDAAFEDAISAGNLHGVGIRSRIYWEWFQKQSSLQFLMEYLERSAGGIELWHFPAGNDKAKEEVRIAATERVSNRNVTLVPIPPGDEGSQYGLQVIEPGMAGIECLKDLLQTYFGHRIKRYILGQTLTSEADATGLGSGVADLHLDTFLQIIKYDATNLEETLTRQLLRPMQTWNFPKSRHIRLKFRLDTEDVDMEKKLDAYYKAYQMGMAIKAKDVADTIGMSMPGPNDEVLKQQQQPAGGMGALPGMPPDQGPPGGPATDGTPPDQPDQPGAGPTDDQGGDPSQQPDMPSGAPAARYSRSSEWTEEDERKHPRGEGGKFAPKGEGQTGGKAKVKVETKKFGEHWYAMADLPGGIPVTRQHKDEKEARRLASEEIRMHGHDVDEGEAAKPVEAPKAEAKPKVKIDLQNFGQKRWYAMADLPNGAQITRSHEDKAEAHRLAAEDVRAAGHEPHEFDAGPKPAWTPEDHEATLESERKASEAQRKMAAADKELIDRIAKDDAAKEQAKPKTAHDFIANRFQDRWDDGNIFKARTAAKEIGILKKDLTEADWNSSDKIISAVHQKLKDFDPSYKPNAEKPDELATYAEVEAIKNEAFDQNWQEESDKYGIKPPHEMSQAEYVSADPKVQEARKMLELTRQNTPHNTFAAQEEVDKAEETAKQMHHIEVAQALPDGPREGDRNPEGLVFRDGRWHRDDVKTGHEQKAGYDSSLEGNDHGLRTSDNVAGTGEPDHGNAEPRMGQSPAEQSAALPSESRSHTGDEGRPGRLPEGRGLSSDAGSPVESGGGNGSDDRERTGDGRPVATGATGGSGRGLGTGGGDGGYRSSSGEAVAKSYRAKPTVENPTDASAGNWRYHTRDFYQGGIKAKFANNLEAIRTMRTIADEGRDTATPAEQEVLSRFVGWGAMPGLFNEYWDEETAEAFGNKDAGYNSDEYKKWIEERDKWKSEREQIKPLLTEAEWAAARKATLNSHFTHPSVIDAHWKMAQKMGFKGGRFLEPSAGIGYYLGLMPPELAGKTRASAIELDPTTGNMLAKLYPKAHVEVRGFEKQQSPKDFYDLVASNVPFGDFTVSDPEYNKFNANIHDYFFLKSADLVKPGGMVMHVTSTGTMDKVDNKIRQELAKTCDFVAAVRFPEGAHQENAGTQVVTDMILLRKRHPGEQPVTLDYTPPEAMPPWSSGGETPISNEEHNARLNKIRNGEEVEPIPDKKGFTGMTTDSLGRVYHWVDGKRVPAPDWLGTKEVPDPAGGEPITVNAYFADHPEQILGTLDRTGTMYGGKQKNVSKTDDYDERLQAAIDRLPAGVFTTDATDKPGASPERREATHGVKNGGFVIHDGKLFRRSGGAEIEQTVNEKDFARIEGQLGIRDAMQAVIDAELAGESPDEARAKLNSVYDAYVKKYGPLSNKENKKVIANDPDAVRLLALESYNAATKTVTKADMFSKATVRSGKQADHANGIEEGVGVCLNETGSIDPVRIAELTGKPLIEVEGELRHGGMAFEDPATGWQPASLYLSGNVRQKLVLARAAAAVDPKYQHNVDALENHQPEDIDYQNIDVRLGAGWVPSSDMQAFVTQITGTRDGRIAVNYVPQTGQWIVEDTRSGNGQTAAMEEFGTEDVPFADLLQRVLNSKSLVVEYNALTPDGNDVKKIDQDATRAAEDKAKQLKAKFQEWIWEDDERRDRLARFYNDNFNNIIPVKYDGSHLQFPGMNPDFQMRDIQKNFVWQVITTGRGLAAHEVGTGKTASMIASAMELRRLGLAKKPCIACMKANIDQITMEAQKLYPNARILSTADNFSAKQRKETISRMSTGDYDLVIMTHDHMNMLGMRPQVVQDYIQSQLNELQVAKKAAWKADPDKNNRIVKALEKAQQKLETRLEKAIKEAEKDDAVHFEETGIDQLFVDEAHAYKNLPVYSTGERVKGIPPASSASDRATNMLMRAQWLMKHNGGRGVVFATGTPVSNTMVELYNIQRYLQPDELKSRGLDTFDAWASAFGDRQTETEVTATGDYDQVTRFNKFVNVPELMNMASLTMDVERADSMRKPDGSPVIIRPKRHDSMVVTPLNEMTEKMMADLKARAMACKGKRPEKGADNMAVICADGRKGSVDMRMLYADAPDDPNSKLNQCVQNVLKLHKERPGVTQCIFSNVGVNPSTKTGFHVYGDIIEKLVAGGIPREKIADFSKLDDEKRHDAEMGMRNGDILVGIGSTERLGTGVNVQQKLAALHHLDVPWKPSEIEQRDGRGWRHGNLNDPTKTMPNPKFDASRPEGPGNKKEIIDPSQQQVSIYRYVSEGSLDQFMWQTVGAKAAFINQTVNAKDRKTRSISDDDTETLTPEQFMAVASGNPNILKKINLQSDIRELKVGHEQHRKDQIKLKDKIKEHEETVVPKTEGIAARHATDAAHFAKHADDEFSIKLGDTVHTKRKDAEEEFEKKLAERTYGYSGEMKEPVGEYKGFKVYMPQGGKYMEMPDGQMEHAPVVFEGPSGALYPARGSLRSLEAAIRGLPKHAEKKAQLAEQARRDLETMRGRVGKEYHRAAELAAKQAELKALDEELKGTETESFGAAHVAEPEVTGPKRTKFKPVTTKWMSDAGSPDEMTESLHHAGVYSNRSVAMKVPDALKKNLLERHPYHAKVAEAQTEPSEHVKRVQKLMASPAQEQPMEFVADRTTRTTKGWGRHQETIDNNHAIFQGPDGKYTALDGEYVSTFQHLYPNVTFHAPVDNKHPVIVKNGADTIGVLPQLDIPQEDMVNHVRIVNAKHGPDDADRYSMAHAPDLNERIARAIAQALSKKGTC